MTTHAEALAKTLALDPFKEILKRESLKQERKINAYAEAMIRKDQQERLEGK